MKAQSLFPACDPARRGLLRRALGTAVFAAMLACASTGSAWAQPSNPVPKSKPFKMAKPKSAKHEQQVFTGSYIRRDIPRQGFIAATASPLMIIDRKQIERSGASSVSGVLRRCGAYR